MKVGAKQMKKQFKKINIDKIEVNIYFFFFFFLQKTLHDELEDLMMDNEEVIDFIIF